MERLAELRGHDFLNVREPADGDVARHVLELLGSAALTRRASRESHVVRHQAGAEPDAQRHQRSNDEIAGPRGHVITPQDFIRSGDRYCSRTYSRCSTARPALHRVTAMMAARHKRLVKTVGTSWKS